MNLNDPSRVLDEISQEGVRQDVNLLPGVLAQIQKGNRSTMKPHHKLVLAILLTMAVLVTLFASLPQAVTAARKMLGFIPGVGLVDQTAPLRVLAEPVSATRDGFTLTVENAVIDAQQTVVTYKVEGPFERTAAQEGDLSKTCFASAELRLPNGAVYRAPEGFPDETWAAGYRVQNTYPALPANIDRATLVLPCLHARLAGQGPENWAAALAFAPAPPDLTVYPLISQATPTPAAAAATPAVSAEADPGPSTDGIQVSVDSVIPLAEGQLVQARVDWRSSRKIAGVAVAPEDVTLYDASGQEIPFEPSNAAIDPNAYDSQSTAYGYKTGAVEAPGPARLVIAGAEVTYQAAATFTFDPGPNRQADQTWDLNQDLAIDGHSLRIISVNVVETGGNASLSVAMQSADGITGAGIVDAAHPTSSGATGSNSDASDPLQSFWASINYDGGLPQGPITLTVSGYSLRLPGPWVAEWAPAAAATGAAAASQPQAEPQSPCLSEAAWKAALAHPQPLPAELNWSVLYEGFNADPNTRHLAAARLDGSQPRTLIENGQSGAISPDGSQLAYLGPQGVTLANLSSGATQVIAGTSSMVGGNFQAFWSPDGQQIAFTGSQPSVGSAIYLAGLDGSAPRPLKTGEPVQLIQGWLPGGQILYTGLGQNGPALKQIDPQSGQERELFNLPQLAAPVSLSQDGKRLAIIWQEPGDGKQTLYVFTSDGSQRKTLLEMGSAGFIRSLLWSPDNQWLLVDLTWQIEADYTQALVQVDTCQIMPVAPLDGPAQGWMKK